MKIRASISAFLLVVLFCGHATAQPVAPKLLPFQGRLTDQNGVAVSNGVRLVQFKIYDVPTGGSPAWAGELHRTTVNGGLVNVMLGSKTPFTGVDFDKQLYLEITVDINSDNSITLADPPMLPRQAILPIVFAKEAADSRLLDGYDWAALFGANNPVAGTFLDSKIRDHSIGVAKLESGFGVPIPIGGVIMWWGAAANIPLGFEICDGAAPTTLGALLQGNKPDLRDRFPKGALAAASDVKSSPVAGGTNTITQGTSGGTAISVAQMPGHNHGINDPGHNHVSPSSYGLNYSDVPDASHDTSARNRSIHTDSSTTGITIQNSGGGQAHDHTIPGHDNRPAFLEMFFIIRVK